VHPATASRRNFLAASAGTLLAAGTAAAIVATEPSVKAEIDAAGPSKRTRRVGTASLLPQDTAPVDQEAKARSNLAQFVSQGKGLVVVHFASGAFKDWAEFRNLVGRTQQLRHDKRGPFTVKIVDPNHPITRGMGDFQTDDELFIDLTGDRPITVLAEARSTITGKDHPMAFVFDYGKGRVFHTPLGHDARAVAMPGTAELIRRGAAWAAKR
jgi:uncharacterized protein